MCYVVPDASTSLGLIRAALTIWLGRFDLVKTGLLPQPAPGDAVKNMIEIAKEHEKILWRVEPESTSPSE